MNTTALTCGKRSRIGINTYSSHFLWRIRAIKQLITRTNVEAPLSCTRVVQIPYYQLVREIVVRTPDELHEGQRYN